MTGSALCASIHFDTILLVDERDGDVICSVGELWVGMWYEHTMFISENNVVECQEFCPTADWGADIFTAAHSKEESSKDEVSGVLVASW